MTTANQQMDTNALLAQAFAMQQGQQQLPITAPFTGSVPVANSQQQREKPALYLNYGFKKADGTVHRDGKSNGIPLWESDVVDMPYIALLRHPSVMVNEEAQRIIAQGYLSQLCVTTVIDALHKKEKQAESADNVGLGGIMDALAQAGIKL